jgi:cytidine deaminase
MKKIQISIEIQEFGTINELSVEDQTLIDMSKRSMANAYAPYSKFKVGVAIRMQDGKIVSGNNQENAAYPSGLCAERVAIFYAMSQFPEGKISTIAITASNESGNFNSMVSPCGACRQAISEYEINQGEPIKLIMQGENGKIYVSKSIEMLLPFMFNKSHLE